MTQSQMKLIRYVISERTKKKKSQLSITFLTTMKKLYHLNQESLELF